MTEQTPASVVERLRAVESSRVHGGFSADRAVTNWHRNPDGPEAAALIESLLAEREGMRVALLAAEDRYQRGSLNMTEGELQRVTDLRRAALATQGEAPRQEAVCICVARGNGPEGCGICNETGKPLPAAGGNDE